MKIKTRYLALALEAIVYLLASLSMFALVASVGNVIGSTISALPRMAPYYLSVSVLIYLLFILHSLLFPKNERLFRLSLKVNGIILAVLSLLAAVLILIKVISKEYQSFLIAGPSPLFPLDYFLLDLALSALGVVFALKGFRYLAKPDRLYFPYEHGLTRRIFATIFRGLYVLLSLYLFGSFVMMIGIANYGSSTWWCMLSLWLLLGVPAGYLFYHDFFFKNGKEKSLEKQKTIALFILGGALFLDAFFLLALLLNRNFIVEDATALFVLDFMKSVNATPYLVSFLAILPPFIAYLALLIEGKKKAKSPQKAPETGN
jgi:hypothetical protein